MKNCKTLIFALFCAIGALPISSLAADHQREFRAGASAIDISPPFGPLLVNGGFTERSVAGMPRGSLYARCLVLDDSTTQIALVVVDNCMIPRDVCDRIKELASSTTGVHSDRILISATHTHSAPSVMDYCLGTLADRQYTEFLPAKVAEGIKLAYDQLEPAQIGWTVANASGFTHCRRWILRPDKVARDPFGELTVRAMMHPGYQNSAYVGPAGPVDNELSILALRRPTGEPISVFTNFSMHYLGGAGPADYFGQFADALSKKLAANDSAPVCMMSQGTSGDLHWMDYSQPAKPVGAYAERLASVAQNSYHDIEFNNWVPLSMEEQLFTLNRRTPSLQRKDWARDILAETKGRRPRNRPEVYAEQAFYIAKNPTVEIKLQTLRIGELGITAIPNEVYGITGLKLKLQSPLQPTFNIELANGAAGYIPPPSQHRLGGYTTWPARTAGLEVDAEPKITAALLTSLENLAGKQRRPMPNLGGKYAESLLATKPIALWKMDEIEGLVARDATGNGNHGMFREGVAFYLNGRSHESRAAHFAGGYMQADFKNFDNEYSISLWCWNGLPTSVREVTGTLFSRGAGDSKESLIIAGNKDPQDAGKLVFVPKGDHFVGRTVLNPKQWYQITMVRSASGAAVYLDGNETPEIEAQLTSKATGSDLYFAGDEIFEDRFAGKLDEIAVFGRVLTAKDVAGLHRDSGE